MNTRDLDRVVRHCAAKQSEHEEIALRCSNIVSMAYAKAQHQAKADAYKEVITTVMQMRDERSPKPARRAFFGMLPA